MNDWIEIFRTGTHTDAGGNKREWTEADLNRMASSYDPNAHEAPLVIGHPKNNGPAYGWVEQLKVQGGKLLMRAGQVLPEFADLVKTGRFKKRSISVYPNGTLRHVGFLGAQPPAIKGLKDVSFGEEETIIYEYQEDTMPTVEELQAQLDEERTARKNAEAEASAYKEQAEKSAADFAEEQKRSRRTEIDTFIDKGIAEAKMLPAWKDQGLAEFMTALDEMEQTYEFAEGEEQLTPGEWFRGFLASFGEHPLFTEMVGKGKEESEQDSDYAEDEKVARRIAGVDQ